MKTKKILAFVLSALMAVSAFTAAMPVFAAEETAATSAPSENVVDGVQGLYAHAVSNSADTEAWNCWQSMHNSMATDCPDPGLKYFFLPSSVGDTVDIYNGYAADVTVNGVTIRQGTTAAVPFETNKSYTVAVDGTEYSVMFMKSTAESAIYANNADADGLGTGLIGYLSIDKSLSSSATAAIVDADGTVDNTAIKKIKGRGNTTWSMPKKSFNITYSANVKIGGMAKSKKYSLLANYQDDSLSRNRFLYDLADAVEMPYASDSRYVDFYSNGYYWGSYLMTEKIEVGKNNVVNDIDDGAYLNADGTINKDFPFLCEVDAGATEGDDYFVQCDNGIKVTIKAPEIDPGDPGYDEVKEYVRTKYNEFAKAAKNPNSDLTPYADIDSMTKLYFINELGKNWDSGVSSTFLVYKQDADGNYKFYGSPVWDYDNSLGNANGVGYELQDNGVTDYTQYTGWWCKFKGQSKRQRTSNNIINNISKHNQIMEAAPAIWFEKFIPAIEYFAGKSDSFATDEIFTADKYYKNLKGSAEMNYQSGWSIYTSGWIADHSSMCKAHFDMKKGEYTVEPVATTYAQDFDGMFNYCKDWFTSRAAWLSNQMYSQYEPPVDPDVKTTVYFDNSEYNWENVYVYAYHLTADGNVEVNSNWPGEQMTALENGVYVYSINPRWNDAYVIFTNGVDVQYPSAEGYTISKGETKIFNGSGLSDYHPTEVLMGDVNGDGYVNVIDATMIQKHAAELIELTPEQIKRADMDNDGDINVKDATAVQLKAAM